VQLDRRVREAQKSLPSQPIIQNAKENSILENKAFGERISYQKYKTCGTASENSSNLILPGWGHFPCTARSVKSDLAPKAQCVLVIAIEHTLGAHNYYSE